ncbi:apotyrosinase chaperone MelC1 [Streptomyces flavofungini]|uniref:apotyrosinase chaperone MelC1 n=1 Tax=Streptomyces flavofungini TaxID=68200 RepID=UPI0025B27520|nr:tyrosinase cofactor [Streptomyces flavofungini]WJV48427.1 tyrosinase cofactor [Streptomyces flavofungini]
MSGITRRRAIGAAASAAVGLAVVGAAAHASATAAAPHDQGHAGSAEPDAFDEVYLGRRIQGAPSHGGGHHGAHAGPHGGHGTGYSVRIDGDELHLMRNADGTWISVINHYEPQATPRALARAAVVELQGARLVPLAPPAPAAAPSSTA